jgi:hypothetical protein
MITTLSDMRFLPFSPHLAPHLAPHALPARRWRTGFIVVLALLLSACGAVRLAYDQGALLTSWWLASRIDLDEAQSVRVREGLDDVFAWHRRTQLPLYADWLARSRAAAEGNPDATALCAAVDDVRGWLEPVVARVVPHVAELASGMRMDQVDRFARRLARESDKRLKQARERTPEQAADAAARRLVDRFETFYGPLEPVQRQWIDEAARVDAQAIGLRDATRRQQREQAGVEGMRRIVAGKLQGEAALSVARQAGQALLQLPEDEAAAVLTRAQRQRQCELAARLHAGATPTQRRHLLDQLRDWENDARQLARR